MTIVLNPVLMYAVQNYITGSPGQGLSLSNSFFVNPVVHDDHDDAGYPKRDGRRYDGVVSVDDEHARHGVLAAERLVLGGRVPTEEYRQERYERR